MSNKIKLTYSGSTKNGIVKMRQSAKFRQEVLQCFPDSELVITVEKKKNKRSLRANSYYWIIVGEVRTILIDAGNAGITIEDVHGFLKLKFNPRVVCNGDGEILEIGSTTTTLSKGEFAEYITRIKAWIFEFFGVHLSDANEQTELELN
jgi:hypothetical protein